jgi:probable HAF family extracellular repeat protein
LRSPDGIKTDLGTLGGSDTRALGINNAGQVVGVSDIDSTTHAVFLWDKEHGMRPIITWDIYYDGCTPTAINESGAIVGFNNRGQAFVWDPVGGFNILGGGQAYDINNYGQITGVFGHDSRPVLWNPVVPEPSSLLALIGGLGALGGLAVRRLRR